MSESAATPSSQPTDRMIGQVLAGRYEIEGRLGKGGMAVVYKAMDRNFGRSVAIKVLRTDVAKDPIAAKRLIREARAAGQLHHPNIITMHDVGTAEGMVYIVMEVLVGSELSDLMEEVGAIDLLRSLDIGRQVASALVVAHRAGIIHRDIKPENLFLIDTTTGSDYVKMLDFSIAKLPSAMVTAALTRAGSVFGTPHYMAPEQVEGRTVCPQTDLYALGAVLYECIAGEPPFDGDSVIDILLQHARAQPPKASDLGIWLPDGLSDLIASLLAKKETDRPESAAAVERRLEQMMEATRKARSMIPDTDIRDSVTGEQIAAHT
ncbi:MAG: serine/threonine protein kinase, partial [Myxococcales bacterium]|nr:serine/threonine protein kinase [Myxococcales bacterium]